MKPPPLLLGATLVFWGWQSGFLIAGVVMAAVIESALLIKARWDFSDDDFSRIWTFCSLLFLGAAVFAFTSNDGPASFSNLMQHPGSAHSASNASARTAASLIRWLPMVFFLFVLAQTFSAREKIPLETISLILRRRWKRAKKSGRPMPASVGMNVSHLYFVICVLAASIHQSEAESFFWGFAVLLVWALWPHRSWQFMVWALALAVVIASGFYSQRGFSQLQRYVASYNAQWLWRWMRHDFDPNQSKTSLGQIGRMQNSGRIVIRLELEPGAFPPDLLREASYRIYRNEVWSVGRSKEEFANLFSETNGTTWVLLPQKTNTLSVNISCYLHGGSDLLPLPTGVARLENVSTDFALQKNGVGAVLADGPGFIKFDARYAPGATIDSPPDDTGDPSIPIREMPALDQVISEMNLAGMTTNQMIRAIYGFFQDKFTYSIWQDRKYMLGPRESPLSHFLLEDRKGHCEYFATATVLLLRRLRIPARYAVGYAVHEASGNDFVVRDRDAHAWCLVWNDMRKRWEDFDTTPASWIEEENKRTSSLQWLSDFWSRTKFEFSKLRWGKNTWREYLLWALIPVLGLLLYQIIRRARRSAIRSGKKSNAGIVWPGLDSEFYQIERALAKQGIARQPNEPLSRWLERAANESALVQMKTQVNELLRLHYRYRFDPSGLSSSDREELKRQTETCLKALHE